MAIRFSPSSLRGALAPRQSVPLLKGNTDSFALITLAVPKSCYSLGARTTFDRGARRCSLYPALQALATSLRMTSFLSLRCGCPVDTSVKQKHRPSRQARCVNGYGNSFLPLVIARGFSPAAIRSSFKGEYGFFRAYHSCGAQKLLFAWSANNF